MDSKVVNHNVRGPPILHTCHELGSSCVKVRLKLLLSTFNVGSEHTQ